MVKTFSLDFSPRSKITSERFILRYSASAITIAVFALPSVGTSCTATTKCVASIWTTDGFLLFGLALTKICTYVLYDYAL